MSLCIKESDNTRLKKKAEEILGPSGSHTHFPPSESALRPHTLTTSTLRGKILPLAASGCKRDWKMELMVETAVF